MHFNFFFVCVEEVLQPQILNFNTVAYAKRQKIAFVSIIDLGSERSIGVIPCSRVHQPTRTYYIHLIKIQFWPCPSDGPWERNRLCKIFNIKKKKKKKRNFYTNSDDRYASEKSLTSSTPSFEFIIFLI